jgi:hypothetical protein
VRAKRSFENGRAQAELGYEKNTLLQRFPDLRLNVRPANIRRRPGWGFQGLEALPVAFATQQARLLKTAG